MGEAVDQNNPDLVEAITFIEDCLVNLSSTVGFLAVSSKYTLYVLEKLRVLSLTTKWWKIYVIIDQFIDNHMSSFKGDNLRDFVDMFIHHKMKPEILNGDFIFYLVIFDLTD